MPDRTPETKGIAEANRHQPSTGSGSGFRARGWGELKGVLQGVHCCRRSAVSRTGLHTGAWTAGVGLNSHASQVSRFANNTTISLRSAGQLAWGRLPGWGIPYSVFQGVGPDCGWLSPAGAGPRVGRRGRSWHRPSGQACSGGWTKLLPSGIHFHSNQPLTAKSQ